MDTTVSRPYTAYKIGEELAYPDGAWIVTRAWHMDVEDGSSFHMPFDEGRVYFAEVRRAGPGEAPVTEARVEAKRIGSLMDDSVFLWASSWFPDLEGPLPGGVSRVDRDQTSLRDLAALPFYLAETFVPHRVTDPRQALFRNHVRVDADASII
ncbi:hypothetical protein GCM10022221_22220 [Actinocorallia aurea]